MPIFVASLIGGLAAAAGSIAGRVLLALGFGFVAYQGIDLLLSNIQAVVVSNINGLPSDLLQLLGLLKVDAAVNILFSAITARFLIMGLTSGTLKKFVVK